MNVDLIFDKLKGAWITENIASFRFTPVEEIDAWHIASIKTPSNEFIQHYGYKVMSKNGKHYLQLKKDGSEEIIEFEIVSINNISLKLRREKKFIVLNKK